MKTISYAVAVAMLLFVIGYSGFSTRENSDGIIYDGHDPNFKIIANSDGIFSEYNRKVIVFGIDIYAVPDVQDEKLLHAGNVLAQYIDNNEDGMVDNQLVLDKMLENKAFVVMWGRESDLDIDLPSDRVGQDLGNDETEPLFVASGKKGAFDASLEDIWHIITYAGYAHAYPDVFGEYAGSKIADAMDVARGGSFTTIPSQYPPGAWYSYDDETCEYNCQVTEYFYWAMTSILGVQENRQSEIQHEWKLHAKDLVQERDVAIYYLLTDP